MIVQIETSRRTLTAAIIVSEDALVERASKSASDLRSQATSGKQKSIFRAHAGESMITTHLGELLLETEKRYGDRVQDWTPIGVETRDGSRSALMALDDLSFVAGKSLRC